MNEYARELINKENWKEADGVITEGTNSALALRDYHVPCCSKHCIIIIQGYHIWWCSSHCQPKAWCEKGRLERERVNLALENVKLKAHLESAIKRLKGE